MSKLLKIGYYNISLGLVIWLILYLYKINISSDKNLFPKWPQGYQKRKQGLPWDNRKWSYTNANHKDPQAYDSPNPFDFFNDFASSEIPQLQLMVLSP